MTGPRGFIEFDPLHFWGYFMDHRSEDLALALDHAWLSVIPVVIGLVISLPLGWLARRYGWLYPPMVIDRRPALHDPVDRPVRHGAAAARAQVPGPAARCRSR